MKAAACVLACLLLAGCEKAMQDMYDQPRYKPLARSELFADGNSARPLPEQSLPYSEGAFAGPSSGRQGEQHVSADQDLADAAGNPLPVNMALLQRGQERYGIYCLPCHSASGDGDGMVVRRGFPRPPSLHLERLRSASDRHLYEVIGNGWGVMYAYAAPVPPADRWAIVAYIRALQLSQHAELARLPESVRSRLPAAGPSP